MDVDFGSDNGFGASDKSDSGSEAAPIVLPNRRATHVSQTLSAAPVTPAISAREYDVLDRAVTLAIEAIYRPRQNFSDEFSWERMMTRPTLSPLEIPVTDRLVLMRVPIIESAQTTMRKAQGGLLSAAVRRVKAASWPAQQVGIRHKALLTWRMVIEENLSSTALGKQLHQLVLDMADDTKLAESIEDAFAGKKSATLVRRGTSLLKYAIWHRKQTGISGLPLLEKSCYAYVKYLQENSAPTSPASFLSAVNFGLYTLALKGAKEVAASARIKGVVFSAGKRKRRTKQSRHLKVDEVKSLEYGAQKHICQFDRYACLFFLDSLYARSRYTAICHADSVIADLDSEDEGFIETPTGNAKIRADAVMANVLLPLVAPATGITGFKWGRAFIEERAKQGLDRFHYLLPVPGVSGQWIDEPTDVGSASKWLRELLIQAGHKGVEDVATHSLKATCLSWASKFGTDIPTRSLLGYHVAREITSTLTYSRDAQSGPLRELIKIIDAIRQGFFMPDESRSGRIKVDRVQPAPQAASQNVTDKSSSSLLSDPYFPCPEGEVQALDKDKSVSSDSSETSSSEDVSSADEQGLIPSVKAARELPDSLDRLVAYVHKSSAVLHCRSVEQTRLKCGRQITVTYTRESWENTDKILRCTQCFR